MRVLTHLWLAILLIAAASSVLLFSDLEHRGPSTKRTRARSKPRIAVMQFTSTTLLDEHVQGIRDTLARRGWLEKDDANLRIFNSQGDFATANAIAGEMVKGDYDLLITSSTVSLQVVAKANQKIKKPHIFGAVTFPQGAGVGISGRAPDAHPPYLAGIGTFQPVQRTFEIAKELNPSLKRVGVVWNPGEQCSETCVIQAREACQRLGITLIEATATQSVEVGEALRSLLTQGVDAIWIGGDTVANNAAKMIIHTAQQADVVVFTNDPLDTNDGALFGLGADYKTVGQYTANMAADILDGASPSDFSIDNVVPERLQVNLSVFGDESVWRMTDAIRRQAEAGYIAVKDSNMQPDPGEMYSVALCYYAPLTVFEMALQGFKDGMTEHGFIEGENLKLTVQHASGNMSLLPQIMKSLTKEHPDVLVPLSTPCLAAALTCAKDQDLVFGIVAAPLEAGAGTDMTNHLPRVTGVARSLPPEELAKIVRQLFPDSRRIGVLYNPAEANAVKEVAHLQRIFGRCGFELVTVTVANTGDVAESAQALLSRQIDLYFAIGDNTAYNALPLVIRYCTDRGIPLLAEDISLMGSGALMSFAPGLYSDGKQTAEMVCRVLLGESPEDMPIAQSQKNEITVDLAAAKALNVPFPQDILTRCDRYFHVGKTHGAPHRIALVSLVENSSLDLAVKGVEEGLQTMGFVANNDYVIASYNAQGEIAQLPQIMDAALSDDPDLIVTVTTPALMAALKKVKEIPLVFTVASDPEKLHLFDHGRPENVCGVHDDPPLNALVEMALRHNPELKIMGTVYDPSQMNAVLSVEKLRAVAETHGLSLVEATASMLSELPMAVQSLQQKGAQALVISADNLTTTGFPALRRAAGYMPIFTTEPRLSTLGATGCIGDDYLDWGRQSGILAARILAGVPPSQLTIGPTQKTVVIEPEAVQAAAEPTALPKQKIRLVLYNQTAFAEEAARGLLDGLKKAGFEEGREYELIEYNANGDVATLAGIMTAVAADKVDMLLVVTTPVLQSALRLAGEDTRIVFTGVASGVLAGAGEDQTNHLARVTGVTTRSPFEGMAQLIHETRPDIRALGTLFTPAEVNSVLYKEYLESALKPYNIALFAVPVTSSSETSMAMDALCRNPVQGICQIMDNTTRPGFQHIARKAADNDLPVYIFESASIKKGATLALARDFYDAGLEAAGLAVRILRGESPAGIPFRNTQSETCTLNSELVERYQLHISPELERRAEIHSPDRINDDALK